MIKLHLVSGLLIFCVKLLDTISELLPYFMHFDHIFIELIVLLLQRRVGRNQGLNNFFDIIEKFLDLDLIVGSLLLLLRH